MVIALSSVVHQRSAWRLSIIFTAMLFAKGRKTITSWLRAAGINRCYKAYYYFIGSLAQKAENIATVLFEIMICRIYKNTNTVLAAIDDSPTSRYGPKVQGAGIHRNPTPTPDGRKFIYGHEETKDVKVFQALYKPAGCLVQVLVVHESKDCFRAFLCTDLTASAVQILEAVADRYAIEQNFSDIKEIEGAGQQQVRTIGSNTGAFHLNLWLHSLIELWAWNKSAKILCNRRDSPWDDVHRRPSHYDKSLALRRNVLRQTFFVSSDKSHEINKIHKQFYKLLKLVA